MFACGGRQEHEEVTPRIPDSHSGPLPDFEAVRVGVSHLEDVVVAVQREASDTRGQLSKVVDEVKTARGDQEKLQVSLQRDLDQIKKQQIESQNNKPEDVHMDFASMQREIAALKIRLDQVEEKQQQQIHQNHQDTAKQIINSLVMPGLQNCREQLQELKAIQEQATKQQPKSAQSLDPFDPVAVLAPGLDPDTPLDVGPRSTTEEVPRFGAMAPISTDAHNLDKYKFEESVWDFALFIGVRQLQIGGSLFSMLLLAINIVVQFQYTVIVMQEFTSTQFDDTTILELKTFRYQIAHMIMYYNTVERNSLATRVCSSDASLVVGSEQASTVDLINAYMPSKDRFFGENQGQVMVVLAMLTWCLVVSIEVRRTLNTAIAFVHLYWERGGPVTKLAVDGTGITRILSLPRHRLVIMASVCTLRLIVAMVLLFTGMEFLVHTTDLRELVLNAVALQFVLDIDELLYAAFAPIPIRSLISSMEPLPILHAAMPSGLDGHAVSHALCVSAAIVYGIFAWLYPEVENLRRAYDVLCGGNQHFIYSTPNFPPYFHWAETRKENSIDLATWNTRTIRKIIHHDWGVSVPAPELRLPSVIGGGAALQVTSGWPVVIAGSQFNPSCGDMLLPGATNTSYKNSLQAVGRELIGRHNISSPGTYCSDYVPFCSWDLQVGQFARMVCPVTCGCTNGTSNLLLTNPSLGCPTVCMEGPAYKASMNIPCAEQNLSDLKSYSPWLTYSDTLVETALRSHWDHSSMFLALRNLMRNLGCGAIQASQQLFDIDMCDATPNGYVPYKSLRVFCPVSCNCSTRPDWDRLHCPTPCF